MSLAVMGRLANATNMQGNYYAVVIPTHYAITFIYVSVA